MPAEDFLKKAAVCRKACWSLFLCRSSAVCEKGRLQVYRLDLFTINILCKLFNCKCFYIERG